MHRLLDGLLAPDPAAMAAAIELAVRHGATSGSDLLAGVLLGLDAATGVAAATGSATTTDEAVTTSLAAATGALAPPAIGHDRTARIAA